MALENQNSLISHTASAGQTQFSYPYVYFNNTDIVVSSTDVNGNVTSPQFTITATNNDPAQGATITLVSAANAGDIVVISREVPITQEYDLQEGATINPTALNKAFDRVVAQNQQQDIVRLRSIQHPTSDPVDSNGNPSLDYTVGPVNERAGKVLGYDEDGNVTELSLLQSGSFGVDSLRGMSLSSGNVASVKIDTDTLEFQPTGELAVKPSKTGAFDNPIVRWDGSNIAIENTIQGAIDNASSGDTIFLKAGTYTENVTINKEGISIIGSGSGVWNGTAGVGGTIIKGAFRWNNAGINSKIQALSLTANNPTNDTNYNLSLLGSNTTPTTDYNCYIEDVAVYGDGFCAHNTILRGRKWFVNGFRSYNAGIHNFPLKCENSVIRNLYIDNNGVTNSSCLLYKSHLQHSGGGIGTPSNTVVDGFTIIASGSTVYPMVLFSNNDSIDENIVNAQLRNGYIDNQTTNSMSCIRLKGGTKTNHFIKDTTIDGVVTKGGKVGIEILEGSANTANKGIDGVYIRNCTFLDPTGSNSGKYAVNNNASGDPAFGCTVGNITVRGYPDEQIVNASNTANGITQQGNVFVIGALGDVNYQTVIDINSTTAVTRSTVSVLGGVATWTSTSTSGSKLLKFGSYPAGLANGETYKISFKIYAPNPNDTGLNSGMNIRFGGQIVRNAGNIRANDYIEKEFTLTAGVKYDGTPFDSGYPTSDGIQFEVYDSSNSTLDNGRVAYIKDLKVEINA